MSNAERVASPRSGRPSIPEHTSLDDNKFRRDKVAIARWFEALSAGERLSVMRTLMSRTPSAELRHMKQIADEAVQGSLRNEEHDEVDEEPMASLSINKLGPVPGPAPTAPQTKNTLGSRYHRTSQKATAPSAIGTSFGSDIYSQAFMSYPFVPRTATAQTFTPWSIPQEINRPKSAADFGSWTTDATPGAGTGPKPPSSVPGTAPTGATGSPVATPQKLSWASAAAAAAQSPIGQRPATSDSTPHSPQLHGHSHPPSAIGAGAPKPWKFASENSTIPSYARPSPVGPPPTAVPAAVASKPLLTKSSPAGSVSPSSQPIAPAIGGSGSERGASPYGQKRVVNYLDIELLSDIGAWLRSLRLHKYTGNLADMPWQEIVTLSDTDLEARGVKAQGARRKLLKMFEEIQAAQAAGKLPK